MSVANIREPYPEPPSGAPARVVKSDRLKARLRAAGWHFLVSCAVAAVAAALVFGLWYPGAFRHMAGGQGLFVLVVSVDVVLGPLLTLVAYDIAKGWPHLRRDLAVIAALQLAGLAYGLHTVYVVRPVAIAYEFTRFRVVSAGDVFEPELLAARPEYQRLPLTGPWTLAVRPAEPGSERTKAIEMALQGVDTSQRPGFWRPYTEARSEALAAARPLMMLLDREAGRRAELEKIVADAGVDPATARFLPVMARGDWSAVLDSAGNIATYLPADGFK